MTTLPGGYLQPAARQGRVERMEYAAPNYLHANGGEVTKTAYVYLPFGYEDKPVVEDDGAAGEDEAQEHVTAEAAMQGVAEAEVEGSPRYNVLFLMHGRSRGSDFLFTWEDGAIVNLLDNMIGNGDIEPLIVVTPTYLAHEGQAVSYTEESHMLNPFSKELKGTLLPEVARRYWTYAGGTGPEELEAARTHMGFGGFSFGAVTTWYVFLRCLRQVAWYMPMYGDCWVEGVYGGNLRPMQTTERLIKSVQRAQCDAGDYHIHLSTGTHDPMYQSVKKQSQSMRRRSAYFTADNFTYTCKQGGDHSYTAVVESLYDALPGFFR